MKINEILNEDDYYPPDPDEARRADAAEREQRLIAFIDNYIEEYLGAPHRGSASRHFGNMKIFISIPRRPKNTMHTDTLLSMQDEWRETAHEIIDEVRRLELGEFEIVTVGPFSMELEEMSSLYESTTAGGMATVVGGLGSTITRNASIYGNAPKTKKKKKKSGKYANSLTEGEAASGIKQDLARVQEILADHDAVKHYKARVAVDKHPHGSYIVVDLGRHGVEDSGLSDMLMSMKTSNKVWVRVVNQH